MDKMKSKKMNKFIKNKKQNSFLIFIIVAFMVLIGGVLLYKTYAYYEEEKSFDVLRGNVPDFSKDVKYIIKVNDENSKEIPSKESGYAFKDAECTKEGSIKWDEEKWKPELTVLKANTVCTLYFQTKIGTTWQFTYTGASQEFIPPTRGNYKISLWGAAGGSSLVQGGNGGVGGLGGFTEGTITLDTSTPLYIYVGGKGQDARIGVDSAGGYNGGGLGTWDHSDDETSGGGGGATDIRLVVSSDMSWRNFDSLKSRLMVASGGGGKSFTYNGGAGGGLTGYSNYSVSKPGSQTSGYKFGVGKDGWGVAGNDGVAGGGSGYFGGETNNVGGQSSGAGGSSFISGHMGCNAIDSNSTENNILFTGQSNHYSGLSFSNTVMIDGAGYTWTTERANAVSGMPTFDGNGTITGNNGNGFAKIVFLG